MGKHRYIVYCNDVKGVSSFLVRPCIKGHRYLQGTELEMTANPNHVHVFDSHEAALWFADLCRTCQRKMFSVVSAGKVGAPSFYLCYEEHLYRLGMLEPEYREIVNMFSDKAEAERYCKRMSDLTGDRCYYMPFWTLKP